MQAIEIRKLKKSFHKDREQIVVIDNLSINFSNGKFYAIVGESGAGKSTLLKCLSLLYSIDSGTIIINNNNVSKLTDDDLCSIRLNEIGIIFQEYNLSPLSFAIIDYRNNIEFYNYETNEYTIINDEELVKIDVLATCNLHNYTINMSVDSVNSAKNSKLLISNISNLPELEY